MSEPNSSFLLRANLYSEIGSLISLSVSHVNHPQQPGVAGSDVKFFFLLVCGLLLAFFAHTKFATTDIQTLLYMHSDCMGAPIAKTWTTWTAAGLSYIKGLSSLFSLSGQMKSPWTVSMSLYLPSHQMCRWCNPFFEM